MRTTMEKYYNLVDLMIETIRDLPDLPLKLIEKVMRQAHYVMIIFLKYYRKVTLQLYGFFRWTTIPLNYIIVRTWLWYIFRDQDIEPLDKTGVHLVVSTPGGGKSMLAFQKSNEDLESTGYASYHTSRIEKPRLSDDERFWIVYHRVINLKRYYRNGTKVLRFNTDQYKALHIDEFHYLNNPRRNKEKGYNDFFLPLLNDLILMRHEGFDNNVYLYSQVPMNDVQLMSILAHYHQVELVKGVDYWRWIRTGVFEIIPKHWKFETFNIDPANLQKRKLYRKWKKKVDVDNLKYFESLAMKHEFDHLPLDYKK